MCWIEAERHRPFQPVWLPTDLIFAPNQHEHASLLFALARLCASLNAAVSYDLLQISYFITILLRFYYFVTIRYESQSVSSDQIPLLFFLYCYILRAKLGRMKRIGIEISTAPFVTICNDSLRFSNFVTNSSLSWPFFCMHCRHYRRAWCCSTQTACPPSIAHRLHWLVSNFICLFSVTKKKQERGRNLCMKLSLPSICCFASSALHRLLHIDFNEWVLHCSVIDCFASLK